MGRRGSAAQSALRVLECMVIARKSRSIIDEPFPGNSRVALGTLVDALSLDLVHDVDTWRVKAAQHNYMGIKHGVKLGES